MNREAIDNETMLQASQWCLRLAEGHLHADEDERLRAWLAANPWNAAAFHEATETWRMFEAYQDDSELMALRHAALAHYGRTQNSRWRSNVRRRRWIGSVAAAAILLVTIGVTIWGHLSPVEYQTGLGERKVVSLEDGSRLTLDGDSTVDVLYRDDRRQIWLRQGRATFQVAHDSTRPFSVRLADKAVLATGTEFSVELVAKEVRVVLYQGAVDVLAKSDHPGWGPFRFSSDTNGRRLERMHAGSELVSAVGSHYVTTREIDPVRARAWESGWLTLDDEPLGTAVERVNRQKGPRIVIEDPSISGMRVSGTFAAGENEAFIEGVTGVLPVRAIPRGDYIALVAAP